MKTRSFGCEYEPIEYERVAVPVLPAHDRPSVEAIEVTFFPDFVPFGRKAEIVRVRRAFQDTEREATCGS